MVRLKNSLYMSHITAGSNAPHLTTLNSGGMLLENAHILLIIMHSDDDSRATRCRTICAPIKKIEHAQNAECSTAQAQISSQEICHRAGGLEGKNR